MPAWDPVSRSNRASPAPSAWSYWRAQRGQAHLSQCHEKLEERKIKVVVLRGGFRRGVLYSLNNITTNQTETPMPLRSRRDRYMTDTIELRGHGYERRQQLTAELQM